MSKYDTSTPLAVQEEHHKRTMDTKEINPTSNDVYLDDFSASVFYLYYELMSVATTPKQEFDANTFLAQTMNKASMFLHLNKQFKA